MGVLRGHGRIRGRGWTHARRRVAVIPLTCVVLADGGSPAFAQFPANLSALSIEDLARIEVTSVSKHAQPLHERRDESADTDRGQLVGRRIAAGTRVLF